MTTDVVKQIRRTSRRRFTAEEKIRIVLEGLRGELPVTELLISTTLRSLSIAWLKAFLNDHVRTPIGWFRTALVPCNIYSFG